MSMQVNSPFRIELIHENAKCPQYTLKTFTFSDWLNFLLNTHGKFVAFKVIELNVSTNSVKFINWLQADFKQLFDYDPMLWLASVGTAPVELRPYLTSFHKEF